MRRFETIQLAAVAVAVFLPVLLGYRLKRGRMAALLLAAMIAQWVVDGFRWQLLPLHVATAGLAVADALREDRRVRGWPRARRGMLGVVGLALLALAPVFLPVPRLPAPVGAFQVGTSLHVVTDRTRQDPYGLPAKLAEEEGSTVGDAVVTDPRQVVVQAWFPAHVPAGEEPLPWVADFDLVAPALSRRLGFPGFLLDQTRGVTSHSYPAGAPLSGRLPVIVYSHGWEGFRTEALDQVEGLASRGFLVLAVDHPSVALATRFPDGRTVLSDPEVLPDRDDSAADYEDASEKLVETMSADLVSVLDALADGADGPFGELARHADLDLIGLYGRGAGGGAAVRACLEDERCGAVAGLDPWVQPVPDRLIASELQVPSMFLRSDEWRGVSNDGRLRGLAERSPNTSYWIGIQGARSEDFTIVPLLLPNARQMGLSGPIDTDVVTTVVDEDLAAFFDRHLLGVGGAAITQHPPSEVQIEVIP